MFRTFVAIQRHVRNDGMIMTDPTIQTGGVKQPVKRYMTKKIQMQPGISANTHITRTGESWRSWNGPPAIGGTRNVFKIGIPDDACDNILAYSIGWFVTMFLLRLTGLIHMNSHEPLLAGQRFPKPQTPHLSLMSRFKGD